MPSSALPRLQTTPRKHVTRYSAVGAIPVAATFLQPDAVAADLRHNVVIVFHATPPVSPRYLLTIPLIIEPEYTE